MELPKEVEAVVATGTEVCFKVGLPAAGCSCSQSSVEI